MFPIDDVRLADGDAPNQGRIEIYFNNTWWKLCSHQFHGDAFRTVCRKLGLSDQIREYRDSQFGNGSASYLHTRFECDGHHSSLLDCRQEQWNGHCGEENSVGVVCGDLVFAGNEVYYRLIGRQRNG